MPAKKIIELTQAELAVLCARLRCVLAEQGLAQEPLAKRIDDTVEELKVDLAHLANHSERQPSNYVMARVESWRLHL